MRRDVDTPAESTTCLIDCQGAVIVTTSEAHRAVTPRPPPVQRPIGEQLSTEREEHGATVREDCDPGVAAFLGRKVVPQPTLARVKRGERRAGHILGEIGATGIAQFRDEGDANEQMIGVARVRREIGFDRREFRRVNLYFPIGAHLNDAVGPRGSRTRSFLSPA